MYFMPAFFASLTHLFGVELYGIELWSELLVFGDRNLCRGS